MPNWCQNTLRLSHKNSAMLDRFAKAFERDQTCNEFVMMPEEYKDNELWYDWRIANWGTKWDFGITDGMIVRVGHTIDCEFDTAWAPPIELYQKLHELGFSVDANYNEPGIGFYGTWTDGEETFRRYECA